MIDSVYEAGKMIKYKSNKLGEDIVQQAYGFGKNKFFDSIRLLSIRE